MSGATLALLLGVGPVRAAGLFLVEVTLLLGLAAVAVLVLRTAPAAARHLVWAAALGTVVLLAVAVPAPPRWTLQIALPASASVAVPGRPEASISARGEGARSTSSGVASPMAVSQGPSWAGTLGGPVAAGWLGGTLLLLIGVVGRAVALRGLVRAAAPVTDPALLDLLGRVRRTAGLRRPVRLRWLPGESSPGTAGLFRPVILLPPAAREWSRTRLEAVLVHELTHVLRHDALTRLMADLACTAVWFHPGVWAAARRLRQERERSCDEAVVRHGIPARSYAQELLAIARDNGTSAQAPILAMARRGPRLLERRINALVAAGRPPRPLRAAVAVALVLLVLVPGALLAGVGVAVRDAPPAPMLQDPGPVMDGHLATQLGPVAMARPADLRGEPRLGCWATDRVRGLSGGRVVVLFAGRWRAGTVRVRLVPETVRGEGAGLASVRVPGMRCWKAPVAGMRLAGEWAPEDVATFSYSAGSELLFATRDRVLARVPASEEPPTLECTFAPGARRGPLACRPVQ